MIDDNKKQDDLDVTSEDHEEQECIDMVLECKDESLRYYDTKFKLFNYFDRLYQKGAAKVNVPYGRANLELPLAFQQIEPFVSQMMETMVSEAPYIAYQGRTKDDDSYAQGITDFTQAQLEAGNFVVAEQQFYRNLAKYGTAIQKIVWESDYVDVETEEEIEVPVIDPVTQMPVIGMNGLPVVEVQKVTRLEQVKKHDGPVFYNIPIFDFFVPKSATSCNVQKLDWCIHRTYRSIEDLLKKPNYKNKDRLIALRDNKGEPQAGANDTFKKTQLDQNSDGKGLKKFDGKVEVLEWWGEYEFEKKEDESDTEKEEINTKPALIVVAICDGEKILLRKEENPLKYKFKPFTASNDYPIEGEFYGYGELYHIKGLIEESTALRNARLDIANLSLNQMWLVERQAGINIRDLYTAPNKIILTNDLNGIRPLPMSGVTPSSVQELAKIDFDIQNTTEIINPRQDVSNVGAAFGGTATGVNFLSAKSNLRLLLKARLLEQTHYRDIGLMLLMYNRDFIEDTVYFRVMGEDTQNPYRAIGPDAFSSDVDFKPTSNPEKLSMAERKNNMEYLLQVIAQIEKVTPGVTEFTELLKEVYKLAGFSHPDRFLKPQQTQVLVTPDQQLFDINRKPVAIIPVDEQGNPIQQQPQV